MGQRQSTINNPSTTTPNTTPNTTKPTLQGPPNDVITTFEDAPLCNLCNSIGFYIPILVLNSTTKDILRAWLSPFADLTTSIQTPILISPTSIQYHPDFNNEQLVDNKRWQDFVTPIKITLESPSSTKRTSKKDEPSFHPIVLSNVVSDFAGTEYTSLWYSFCRNTRSGFLLPHEYNYEVDPSQSVIILTADPIGLEDIKKLHATNKIPAFIERFLASQPSQIPFCILCCDLCNVDSINSVLTVISKLSQYIHLSSIPSLSLQTPLILLLSESSQIDQVICSEQFLFQFATNLCKFSDVRSIHIAESSASSFPPTGISKAHHIASSNQELYDYLDDLILQSYFDLYLSATPIEQKQRHLQYSSLHFTTVDKTTKKHISNSTLYTSPFQQLEHKDLPRRHFPYTPFIDLFSIRFDKPSIMDANNEPSQSSIPLPTSTKPTTSPTIINTHTINEDDYRFKTFTFDLEAFILLPDSTILQAVFPLDKKFSRPVSALQYYTFKINSWQITNNSQQFQLIQYKDLPTQHSNNRSPSQYKPLPDQILSTLITSQPTLYELAHHYFPSTRCLPHLLYQSTNVDLTATIPPITTNIPSRTYAITSETSENPLELPTSNEHSSQQQDFRVNWTMSPFYLYSTTSHSRAHCDFETYLEKMVWAPTSIGLGVLVIDLSIMFDQLHFNSQHEPIQKLIKDYCITLRLLYYAPYKIHIIFTLPIQFIDKYYLVQPHQATKSSSNKDQQLLDEVKLFMTQTYNTIISHLPKSSSSEQLHTNYGPYPMWSTSQKHFPALLEFIKYQSTIERVNLIHAANYSHEQEFK